jgi:hypothetical protein
VDLIDTRHNEFGGDRSKRKADKMNATTSGDNSLIIKSEMRNEMRCMIQELMEWG